MFSLLRLLHVGQQPVEQRPVGVRAERRTRSASRTPEGADELEPGLHLLNALHDDGSAMPIAAAAWNVGGMGAHWTVATPWPSGAELAHFEIWRAGTGTERTTPDESWGYGFKVTSA